MQLAVKMQFALQKIINKFVNANLVIQVIQKSHAKSSIIVRVHLVLLVQLVEIIVDHSNVSANKDLSVTLTIMDVKNLRNVKSITIVRKLQNVSMRMDRTSVKMFVKEFVVDRMLNALPKIMQLSVNVDSHMKEIQKIEQTVADQNQIHAQLIPNVLKIHIAMVLFANQRV